MRTAFYTGTSGLVACQERMDVIGNNLANCNTTGYKAQRTVFSQLLSSKMSSNSENPMLVGTGVRTENIGIDPGQGTTAASSSSLDLAISGNGWFCVDNNGIKEYTRNGAFSISLTGNNAYLVNQSGAYVLDSSRNRIFAAVDPKTNVINSTSVLDKVGVFTFSNPEALTPTSSNSYLSNSYTGTATLATNNDYTVLKGFLEQSDVSITDEMAALIMAQRGYQLSARVVQTADEVEQVINSLRS